MRTNKWFGIWTLGVFLAASAAAQAQDWSVIVNGKAIHLNASRNWNEDNYGLGLEREVEGSSPWVRLQLVNGFLDSADHMSYMAGGGLMRRFRFPELFPNVHVDVGAVAFVMTRADVRQKSPVPGRLAGTDDRHP